MWSLDDNNNNNNNNNNNDNKNINNNNNNNTLYFIRFDQKKKQIGTNIVNKHIVCKILPGRRQTT